MEEKGAPKLLSNSEMNEISINLETYNGKSVGEDEIVKAITQKKKQRLEDAGIVPLSIVNYKPSDTTLRNYKCAMLVKHDNLSTTISTVSKTNTRYTAENSLMSTVAFAAVVASTHYVLAEEECPETRADMKSDKVSVGVKLLYDIVDRRLCDTPTKKSHWVVSWIRKNLSACAAIMTIFKHTKDNLSCLDETKTLLTTVDRFLMVTNSVASHQGVYLYYDTNDHVWIRSGKVTGLQMNNKRGFLARHDEHRKKAEAPRLTTRTSRFYISYPSSTNPRVKSKAKKGIFEDLRQYVGCGFNPQDESILDTLTRDEGDGGVFLFDDTDKENINKVHFRGLNTFREKDVEMVAYLLELAYDLAIAPRDNISSSPGFETIFGAVV